MDESTPVRAPDPQLTPEQRAMVQRAVHRVPQIARGMRHLLGGISLDECESAGYEALVRSALRYDPAVGVPFMAFAYPRVRGAMLDAARRASPDRRRLARAIKMVEAADAARTAEAAPAPAGDPRTLAERVAAAAAMIRDVTTAAMLTRISDVDPEQMADRDAAVDEQLAEVQTRVRVQRALARCEPDERELLTALYFRDASMHDHAAAIGVNVSTVSRRHARALRRLSEWLRERPP